MVSSKRLTVRRSSAPAPQHFLAAALELAHGCVDVAGLTTLEVGHLPKIEDRFPLGLSRPKSVADEENNHEADGGRATHEVTMTR